MKHHRFPRLAILAAWVIGHLSLVISSASGQVLPTPVTTTVTANADATLRSPANFWEANQAAIASAISLSGYQPLDSDLTSIAALTTTSFGRGLLTQADAAAARGTLGLTSAATGDAGGLGGGTVADARLSANVALRNAANTYTAAAQIAPSWRLPAYAGTATLPVGASGMGWDELGRFTLQTPVGAFQVYSVGSPAVPTLYWPGTIVSQRLEAPSGTLSLSAGNITAGAGGEGIGYDVMRNSLLPTMAGWLASVTAPAGIPVIADGVFQVLQGGTYFPRQVITQTPGTGVWGSEADYRTAAQLRGDLGLSGVATRTITGTANQITVTNGDGSAGNPVLALANNTVLPGNPSTAGMFTSAALVVGASITNTNQADFGNTSLMPSMTPDGTTGMVDIYANSIFGARIHSENSNGVTVSSTNGQAGKFIQGGSGAHSTIPVLRVHRSNTNTSVTSPSVVIADAAGVGSGGAVLRAEKVGIPVFAIDNRGLPILRAPNGSYWRLEVSNAGVLSTVSVAAP